MTNRNHFNENFKKIRVTGNILIWSYLHLVYFILPVYNFEKKITGIFPEFSNLETEDCKTMQTIFT